MNNNNRGNNRRRGRGGNRQQGGQQTNRIDSRARGNAPQLLEKYKKLAHDAHLNGDRVQEEYYLQFADHYFRVIADQRQRQEEARQPRRDDRSPDYGEDAAADDETEFEAARPYHDRSYQDRGSHEERGREERGSRDDRAPRGNVEERSEPVAAGGESGTESERSVYEPVENPFVRDSRGPRAGLKQRKPRRNRDDDDDSRGNVAVEAMGQDDGEQENAPGNFDPAALPPAISAKADGPKRRPRTKPKADEEASEGGEEKPKRRRTRKASPSGDSADGAGGETLEAID